MKIKMKRVSNDIKEIGESLSKNRLTAYIDIYKETEFSGVGYLLDRELNLYRYEQSLGFNKETHDFGYFSKLDKSDKKIDIDIINNYLLNEINIMTNIYDNNSNEEESFSEIFRLDNYVGEFNNKELFDLVKNKLSKLLEEDI